ncbi:hypothetical protein P22_3707 [Propionispora sp. 2/2-37]|uniref:aspartyl-phosphate phosphatase Spo0E family protein n=1 Tax=Propionispora sp. 2/2-37 TaxID=1677858 RepID=UPI0006BB94AA|nr:aspartyl-phosphate phosphatase Spo0E family protein [Propionispora sp. 2/2-37]CUH97576.1 hypothetical protein P22_3707 [Propionispora sp. 2/2-37]
MSDLKPQQQAIESARLRLHKLVAEKGGRLSDPEVAELSAYLDKLIVEYERSKRERAVNSNK